MKYVTLAEFLKLSPSEQCKVTHIDLSLASEEDRVKMRALKYLYMVPNVQSLKEGKDNE